MRHFFVLLLVAAIAGGCQGKRELTPGEIELVAQLRTELTATENDISSAEKENANFSGGLVKALIATRLEILKTNKALIQQQIHAIESGAPITVSVPTYKPDPQEAERLAKEIESLVGEIKSEREDASKYSGGLVLAMKLSGIATQEQTLAMLKQRQLSAKYGLAAPAVLAPCPKVTQQDAQNQQQVAKTGNDNDAAAKTEPPKQIDIEALKAHQDITVESAHLYKAGSYIKIYGVSAIVKNNTEKVVKEYSISFLCYDKDGFPLKIGPSGVLKQGKAENSNIKPRQTHGKGTYFSLPLGTIDEDEIKTVLACVSSATYYDGTTWENPYYNYWIEKYEDKPIEPVPQAKGTKKTK